MGAVERKIQTASSTATSMSRATSAASGLGRCFIASADGNWGESEVQHAGRRRREREEEQVEEREEEEESAKEFICEGSRCKVLCS